MTKRILGMIAAILVVVGAIAFWKYYTIRTTIAKMTAQKPQPTAVSSIKAPEEVWQDRRRAVGSLAAVQGVMVSNELPGTVQKITFESGGQVKQGDLLVQLDVSAEAAELRGLEAQTLLARINDKRAQELRRNNTNSQGDLDAAQAQYQQTLAAADTLKATIAKKTITAPFAGRLGLRQVNLGQYLAVGTAIVTLQALDPIYVNFALPQQDVVDLTEGQKVQLRIDAYPDQTFEGAINAISPKVDDASRNLQVQATLGNANARLKPGMFGSVDVLLPRQSKVITLPQAAIVYNPYGDAVYVVEKAKDAAGADGLVARQRFVQLGETRGDQVAVLKGVKIGDEVVTSGQLKLRNGAAVEINNSITPENNPAPTLPNN
ncbi:MAG TPA: efflux RND transporter periplasmic adaptor subunit [Opitutaceae bacterium]|nr:efflux RND transporter periplasmic adaptor subunit [Opitutaceae bacterium]